MLRQFLVGTAVSVCNIAIHAMVTVAVIRVARIAGESATSRQSLRLIAVMIATVSVLMAAHLAEVLVWSLAYAIVGVAPPGTDLIYFAFVNYTTLGYGDVTPVERWHLLGPMTAMNGVLLFGWSTAVIFEVLRKALVTFDSEEGDRETGGGASNAEPAVIAEHFRPVGFCIAAGLASDHHPSPNLASARCQRVLKRRNKLMASIEMRMGLPARIALSCGPCRN